MAEGKTIEVSRVTVGLLQVGAMLVALFGLDWRIEDRFGGLEKEQSLTTYRLGKIEEAMTHNVSASEFTSWAESLQSRNPTLTVPAFRK